MFELAHLVIDGLEIHSNVNLRYNKTGRYFSRKGRLFLVVATLYLLFLRTDFSSFKSGLLGLQQGRTAIKLLIYGINLECCILLKTAKAIILYIKRIMTRLYSRERGAQWLSSEALACSRLAEQESLTKLLYHMLGTGS